MDEIKFIQLTHGAVAKVSAEDYEMVNRFKWRLTSNGYAQRRDLESDRIVYLHREINRTPAGRHTDHIDGDRLNCTRVNLRTATISQNAQNKRKQRGESSSQFKGVSFRASTGKGSGYWDSYIKVSGKKIALGHYATEMDAALAYNLAATKAFGEFAKLNILPWDFLSSRAAPIRFSDRKHSKYRGVTWHKSAKKWMAYFSVNGKRVHESFHSDEESAHQAYLEARSRFAGENHASTQPCALAL